jgi:HlyD family secretion protein
MCATGVRTARIGGSFPRSSSTVRSRSLAVASFALLLVACGAPAPPARTAPTQRVPASGYPAPGIGTPTAPSKEIAVRTAPVVRADVLSSATYTGDVRAKAALNVVPKTAGRIEKLHVDVGSQVKAGDRIAELDRDAPQLAVRQAEAGLTAAKARLAQMEAGARPDQVAQAEAAARAARARAESAGAGGRAETVAQAQAQLDSARQRLAALTSPRQEAIGQADANVAAAQARLDALLKGTRPEEVQARELAVEQARRALEAAWKQRDGVCGFGSSSPCDQARAAAIQAEAAVRAAEQQVTIAKSPPTAEAVAQAQAALDAAKEQAQLARKPASEFDLAQGRDAVRAAEAAVALAQRPTTAGDVEAAQAQAEAAEAQAKLAAAPFTKEDLEAARAAVAQAQAQLDIVRAQLKELTIVSPVDGTVAERMLVAGAIASPATPIVLIISPELEVVVAVEEARLARVTPGQEALITVPAFPGQPFAGKVSLVAPTVDQRSRTGQVKVEPTAEALGKLRPGMFAEVKLVFERKAGVLAIPSTAVLGGPDPAVVLVADGLAKRVPVQLGLRDGDKVEVLGGLQEGEAVVVDGPDLRDGDRVSAVGRG